MSALMLVLYVGLIGLTYFQFARTPVRLHSAARSRLLHRRDHLAAGREPGADRPRRAQGIGNPDVASRRGACGGIRRIRWRHLHECSQFRRCFRPVEAVRGAGEGQARHDAGILNDLRGQMQALREAFVLVIPPPSVPGIGTGGGFKLYVQDRAGRGPRALEQAVGAITGPANQTPGLVQVFTLFNTSTPQVYADIDRTKAEMLGVPITRFFDTLSTYMGSTFVNDFNILGRTYRVTAQADNPFRLSVRDVENLRTRSVTSDMVPLGAVASFQEITGPYRVPRYNLFPAAEVQGATLPGFSTGQAIAAMEKIVAANLPSGFGFEWTEIALQEKVAGNTAAIAFSLAVVFVFLLLAAQYESVLLAARRDPDRADVPVRGDQRRAVARHGQQHPHPDRLRGADRAGREERDPDRRVRETGRGAGGEPVGRGRAGGAHASAADPDDVVRVHPWRGAADAGDRRRRRDASGARHGRVLRHARRDVVRAAVHPGVLRAGAQPRGNAGRSCEASCKSRRICLKGTSGRAVRVECSQTESLQCGSGRLGANFGSGAFFILALPRGYAWPKSGLVLTLFPPFNGATLSVDPDQYDNAIEMPPSEYSTCRRPTHRRNTGISHPGAVTGDPS